MKHLKRFLLAIFEGVFGIVGGIFEGVFGLIIGAFILLLYFGIPVAIVAMIWKPGLDKTQKYVAANNELHAFCEKDSVAQICVEKNWFYNEFYIKTSGKLIDIGSGFFWKLKINADNYTVAEQSTGLDECETLFQKK